MNLLFVSNLYPPVSLGGYEYVCRDVTEALRRRGHSVTVLSSDFHSQDAPAQEQIVRELWLWRDYREDRPLHTRIRLERHNARTIARAAGRIRPDLIMVWNGGNLGRAVLSVAEQHAPTMYYLHDPWLAPVLTEVARPARAIYRLALRPLGLRIARLRPRTLVFISQSLQEQYRERGVDISGSSVVRNGLDPDHFARRPSHLLTRAPSDPAQLLYVGRLAPEKGIGTLITALASLRRIPALAATRLSLLGETDSRAYALELRRAIDTQGVSEAVTFLARRPRDQVAQVYAEHDLLVFPSEWREPFSLTLLEAMATGIPVVATLSGGSAEVIRDGQNALVFRAGDAADLTAKLAWALGHAHAMAAMAAAASEEMRARYRFDDQVSALEEIMRSTVPEPAAR